MTNPKSFEQSIQVKYSACLQCCKCWSTLFFFNELPQLLQVKNTIFTNDHRKTTE